MSYITKFQANYYYAISDKNKVMKQNKIDVIYYVELDSNGEYRLKKKTNCGNLPDKLKAYKQAREVLNLCYETKKLERAQWGE